MFPVRDNVPHRRVPVALYSIMALNIVLFLMQVGMSERQLNQVVYLFGIVPRRYTDPAWAEWVGFPTGDYWPFLTSMFLHGGWLHIISNMWTLGIFGNNVEDRMGMARFIVFYILCGVASGVVHTLTNFGSTVPAIGASGAIAGVLAAYLVLYPTARILCVFPILFIPLFFELPAVVFIALWYLMQLYSGTLSLFSPGEGGGIAWWAHIGGFITGLVLLPYFVGPKPPERRPPPLPPYLERDRPRY